MGKYLMDDTSVGCIDLSPKYHLTLTPRPQLRPLQIIPTHLPAIRIFEIQKLAIRTRMHHVPVQHLTHTMLCMPLIHDHLINRFPLIIRAMQLAQQKCTMRLMIRLLHKNPGRPAALHSKRRAACILRYGRMLDCAL
jgi:hypothetical protein